MSFIHCFGPITNVSPNRYKLDTAPYFNLLDMYCHNHNIPSLFLVPFPTKYSVFPRLRNMCIGMYAENGNGIHATFHDDVAYPMLASVRTSVGE